MRWASSARGANLVGRPNVRRGDPLASYRGNVRGIDAPFSYLPALTSEQECARVLGRVKAALRSFSTSKNIVSQSYL